MTYAVFVLLFFVVVVLVVVVVLGRGGVTCILVYVPGPDFKTAAERIKESFNEAVSRSVDQPLFNLGDFCAHPPPHPAITFQKRNTSISISFSSRYDTVYIWETDIRKMLLGITG